MNRIVAVTIGSLCLLFGCSKDEGSSFGTYYEFTFADDISAFVTGDSIHVVVIETPVTSSYLQAIPFGVTDNAALLDTIKMALTVFYGGYSPTPSPMRNVGVQQDSIILKYDRTAFYRGLAQEVGSNKVETSPRPTYYSIRHVEIFKTPNRHVTFESRLVH